MNIAHPSVSRTAGSAPAAPLSQTSQPAAGFGETLAASLRDSSQSQKLPVAAASGAVKPGMAAPKSVAEQGGQRAAKERKRSEDLAGTVSTSTDAPPDLLVSPVAASPAQATLTLPQADVDHTVATAAAAAGSANESQPGLVGPAASLALAAQAGTAVALVSRAPVSQLPDEPSGRAVKQTDGPGVASEPGSTMQKPLQATPGVLLSQPAKVAVHAGAPSPELKGTAPALHRLPSAGVADKTPSGSAPASEPESMSSAAHRIAPGSLSEMDGGIVSTGAVAAESRGALLDVRARNGGQAAESVEDRAGATGTPADAGTQSQSSSQSGQNAQDSAGQNTPASASQDQCQMHLVVSSSGTTVASTASAAVAVTPVAAAVSATAAGMPVNPPATPMAAAAHFAAGAGSPQSATGTAPGAAVFNSAPAINTVQVLSRMSTTEMRVGMRSDEFGSISIATSLSPGNVTAQIALDHSVLGGALSQALVTHLPGIEERLGSTLGVTARVEIQHADSGSGSAPGSSTHGQTGSGENRERGGSSQAARSPVVQDWSVAAATPDGVAGPGTAGRLSVRV